MFKQSRQTSDAIFSPYELCILGICALVIIGLGFCGYADYYANSEQVTTTSDLLYKSVALFTFGFYAQTGDISLQLGNSGDTILNLECHIRNN